MAYLLFERSHLPCPCVYVLLVFCERMSGMQTFQVVFRQFEEEAPQNLFPGHFWFGYFAPQMFAFQ